MAREERRDHEPPEFVGFDWDEGNLLKNWEKHGITNQEAEEVFFNDPVIRSDPAHSQDEERYLAYGVTNGGRFLTVVYTMREDRIRVVSARPMNRWEREILEGA